MQDYRQTVMSTGFRPNILEKQEMNWVKQKVFKAYNVPLPYLLFLVVWMNLRASAVD